MFQIERLTKKFGNFTAVDNISLSVAGGEIFSFLGVNGAGKTTTLRMLAGVLNPTSGRITIAGIDLAENPRAAKSITGYIPDRPHIYTGLTAREYLYFIAELYSMHAAEAERRIDQLLEEYLLREWEDFLIESFSHGMRQRLAICAALVPSPQVLVIDEPIVGLDPHGTKFLKESFKAYARAGMTIFLSTHSLHIAEEVSDRLAIIHAGKIVAQGTLASLRELSGAGELGLEELFLRLTLPEPEQDAA